MIWSIVSKKEMEGDTSPVFKDYQEALGKDNIQLAIVDEDDKLDFLKEYDTALLRTASRQLINTIHSKRKVSSTAEDFDTYMLALDKIRLSYYLVKRKVYTPGIYLSPSDLQEGKAYIVKPLFGGDASPKVCHSIQEVEVQMHMVRARFSQMPIIEEYLEGPEYTVACVSIGETQSCYYPLELGGSGKMDKPTCKYLVETAQDVCRKLKIKHHARIDFREDAQGRLFVIDVNLIPSLGPNGKWAKCMAKANLSYTDALKLVIASAT